MSHIASKARSHIALARPRHWVKNVLVLVPLVFGHSLGNTALLGNAVLGTFAFCFVSSAVYVFNDIRDAPKDRLHPVKRNRPIASGAVGVGGAWAEAVLFLAAAAVLQALTGAWAGAGVLAAYVALNVLYSLGLKNRPIVDIVILASGFLLRVMYGAMVTGIAMSGWLYLTVISGSFYLGFGKRRGEIDKAGGDGQTREVLKYYNYAFLDKNMYVCLALTEAFYALWAISLDNAAAMVWTVPVVMVIFMQYSLDIEGDSYGDPVDVFMHDWGLILLAAVYVAMTLAILYLL